MDVYKQVGISVIYGTMYTGHQYFVIANPNPVQISDGLSLLVSAQDL